MGKIIDGYDCIRDAQKIVNEQIDESDRTEVELIDIKRLLECAIYCFEGLYVNNLAEAAGVSA